MPVRIINCRKWAKESGLEKGMNLGGKKSVQLVSSWSFCLILHNVLVSSWSMLVKLAILRSWEAFQRCDRVRHLYGQKWMTLQSGVIEIAQVNVIPQRKLVFFKMGS